MKNFLLVIFTLLFLGAKAQEQFSVNILPSTITAMPPVHSGAFAEWNGKWIIIGGRIEGLHNFQSGFAFSTSGRNDSVFVVDPVANTCWSGYAGDLPVDLFESICSNNMEFYQDSSTLYMVGGFGRQGVISSWTTFPVLTAVDINGLSNAVINGTPVDTTFFRQYVDTNLAVAGGQLEKIDSTYYLVFGQRFNGIYSSTGAPIFTQHYSEEIRKFNIHDDGVSLNIANYSAVSDTDNFHRRDYNLVRQIYPNGDFGFTAFGGVFQKAANLPFLSPVDITATYSQLNSSFNQNLNQYETAAMPVYDSSDNYMHTIFFGGMSEYTYDTTSHALVQDTLIPFVKTISKVTRDNAGNLVEYSLPVQMPSLLGTNARFIPVAAAPVFHNKIINLNVLAGNTLVGYIISGIRSDFPNISGLDPSSMSRANTDVFEVYIDKSPNAVNDQLIRNSVNDLTVSPNPSHGIFNISFSLNESLAGEVSVFNSGGKKILSLFEGTLPAGISKFSWDAARAKGGTYLCRIKAGDSFKAVKLVLQK